MTVHNLTTNRKNPTAPKEHLARRPAPFPKEKSAVSGSNRKSFNPLTDKMTHEQLAIQTAASRPTRLSLGDGHQFLKGVLTLAGEAPETVGLWDAVMLLECGGRRLKSIAVPPAVGPRRETQLEEQP